MNWRRRTPKCLDGLPPVAEQYVREVVARVRMRPKVNGQVCEELAEHFHEALRDCGDADRSRRAGQLVAEFGDARLLGKLIRRAKKRCRPAWVKAIIRSFQAIAAVILLLAAYTFWLATGSPTISGDYLAKLNALCRPQVPDDMNAWPLYQKAIDLYVEPAKDIAEIVNPRYSLLVGGLEARELTAEQQQLIAVWIEANQPAWEEYDTGTHKPYCWIEYSMPSRGPLVALAIPSIARMRSLAWLAVWRAQAGSENGQVREAIDCCLAAGRAGAHLHNPNGILIQQLVGMRLDYITDVSVLRLAGSDMLALAGLRTLQDGLQAIYADGYPAMGFEGEKLFCMDMIQHCFTDGGPGGGHLIPRRVSEFFEGTGGPIDEWLLVCGGAAFAGRTANLAKVDEFYSGQSRVAGVTPHQWRGNKSANRFELEQYVSGTDEVRFPLLAMVIPSTRRATELNFQAMAGRQATVTVLALRRYRLDKGAYPEYLNRLVEAGYLAEVPRDPYSDGALVYRVSGDEFTLYSVGEDFTDNGGMQDPEHPWGTETGESDRVFWPVQQDEEATSQPPT
jgi:hypothetical protein